MAINFSYTSGVLEERTQRHFCLDHLTLSSINLTACTGGGVWTCLPGHLPPRTQSTMCSLGCDGTCTLALQLPLLPHLLPLACVVQTQPRSVAPLRKQTR